MVFEGNIGEIFRGEYLRLEFVEYILMFYFLILKDIKCG